MSDYVLSCSSTADLSQEEFDARDIRYICFHYSIDGVQMFVKQAAAQFELWTGKKAPVDVMHRVVLEELNRM